MGSERGQASVELVAMLPLLLVVGLVGFQLLAAGYSAVLAGDAAEAGALALAGGADAEAAARAAGSGGGRAPIRVVGGDGPGARCIRPPPPPRAGARQP